jgi:hypothetical protein
VEGEAADKDDDNDEGQEEGFRRSRRVVLSLSTDEIAPSDTSAEVSQSRLRDDVSIPAAAGIDDEEGSFERGSEKEKVAIVEAGLGSAVKLLFLAGQLDGRIEVAATDVRPVPL